MNRKELINLDNLAKIFSEFIIFYYLNLHLFEVLYKTNERSRPNLAKRIIMKYNGSASILFKFSLKW